MSKRLLHHTSEILTLHAITHLRALAQLPVSLWQEPASSSLGLGRLPHLCLMCVSMVCSQAPISFSGHMGSPREAASVTHCGPPSTPASAGPRAHVPAAVAGLHRLWLRKLSHCTITLPLLSLESSTLPQRGCHSLGGDNRGHRAWSIGGYPQAKPPSTLPSGPHSAHRSNERTHCSLVLQRTSPICFL